MRSVCLFMRVENDRIALLIPAQHRRQRSAQPLPFPAHLGLKLSTAAAGKQREKISGTRGMDAFPRGHPLKEVIPPFIRKLAEGNRDGLLCMKHGGLAVDDQRIRRRAPPACGKHDHPDLIIDA